MFCLRHTSGIIFQYTFNEGSIIYVKLNSNHEPSSLQKFRNKYWKPPNLYFIYKAVDFRFVFFLVNIQSINILPMAQLFLISHTLLNDSIWAKKKRL